MRRNALCRRGPYTAWHTHRVPAASDAGSDAPRGRELMAAVAADVQGERDTLIAAMMHRLRLATPELFATPALEHALRTSSAANIRRVHQLLLVPHVAESSTALPPEAHDLTATCIRHGVALVALLESWRVGQAFVSDWWRHRVEERAQDRGSLVTAVETMQLRISAFADAATAEIRSTYEHERRSWEGTLPSRRSRLVRDILAGERHELHRAGAILNYPLDGRHTAGVLWLDERSHIENQALDDALAAIYAQLGGAVVLTIAPSHRTIWVWLASSGPADKSLDLPTGTALALGSCLPGLSGFRRSHVEALQAQRIAMMAPRQPMQPVRYRDVELASLMSRQPADMWWFVHRTLGALAIDNASTETLRTTLAAYIASGFSPTSTARALHTHRNTVTYRLQKIAELLGDDFIAHAAELTVALRLVHALGSLPPGWDNADAPNSTPPTC